MRYMKPASLFQELVKSKALQKGRFLGLDVGDKYVGVSVSDEHNKIALPGSVLLRKKEMIDLMATDFQCLISELSIAALVVGYPFDRQRSSPDAVQVNLLIDDLCASGKLEGVKYTYWDECFTSKSVELLVQRLELHPVRSKTILDKFAAIGILQGYLDFVNRNERLRAMKEDSADEA
ncbi:RNA processing factor [Lithospermum erythrorhizon]|uniref:RNA processing factor n=1 Tax=Lithospermum erythrorhizon TaxID=34254 RepID=A0AAV3QEH9_LITER